MDTVAAGVTIARRRYLDLPRIVVKPLPDRTHETSQRNEARRSGNPDGRLQSPADENRYNKRKVVCR
jgi:hypothetical protein